MFGLDLTVISPCLVLIVYQKSVAMKIRQITMPAIRQRHLGSAAADYAKSEADCARSEADCARSAAGWCSSVPEIKLTN